MKCAASERQQARLGCVQVSSRSQAAPVVCLWGVSVNHAPFVCYTSIPFIGLSQGCGITGVVCVAAAIVSSNLPLCLGVVPSQLYGLFPRPRSTRQTLLPHAPPLVGQCEPCSPAQATALLHSLTPEARRPMQALPDCPAIEASSTTAPRQPTLLPFPTHPEIEASKVGTFSCSLRSGRPVSPSRPGRIDRAGPPISRSPLVPFPASTARAGRCIGGRPRPSN